MNIPLNIDWQQILLHLFNFSILAGGLYLLLFKPVKNFMDKRAKHYADMESAAVEREKNTAALEASMQQRQAALDAELDEKRAAITAAVLQMDLHTMASGIIQKTVQQAEKGFEALTEK